MTEHPIAELLGRLEAPAALRSTEQAQRADARHVRALARNIAAVPSRKRRVALMRAVAAGGVGLAGAAVLWLTIPRAVDPGTTRAGAHVLAVEGEAQVRRAETSFTAHAGDPLAAGDRVQLAPGASTRIEVSTRAAVELSSRAELELLEVGSGSEQLRLGAGRGRFAVGLPRGAFSVESPHLRVNVTGTEFTVTVETNRTCVIVHQGKVIATSRTSTRSATLGPEQAFSSDGEQCTSLPVVEWIAPRPRTSRAAPSALPPRPREVAASPRATDPIAPRPSTLEDENRILLAAIAARRAGRLTVARTRLRQLLSRYPDTPLRPAAENELRRIADATQPAASSSRAGDSPRSD
jgi:hypothetical protein